MHVLIVVKGLAWTSVHPAGATTLITRLLFTPTRTTPITNLEKQGQFPSMICSRSRPNSICSTGMAAQTGFALAGTEHPHPYAS